MEVYIIINSLYFYYSFSFINKQRKLIKNKTFEMFHHYNGFCSWDYLSNNSTSSKVKLSSVFDVFCERL